MLTRKLTASPNFALCHAADGSAFVMGEVEPYAQYWLSDRERLLFALCGRKGGLSEKAAIAALLALKPRADPVAERRRIRNAIHGMAEAGVLIAPAGELSRYGKDMARDYLEHRPFPLTVAEAMAQAASISTQSRVLDLASGPGSLALDLARRTPHVTIMDLSRGFVALAQEEAARRGLALAAINESANRLPWHDGRYDLVTISQALHWLDDVAVCKGLCRILAEDGSFMVIHAAITLPDAHPLAHLLGNRSLLGNKAPAPFAEQVRPLFRRLALLFEALDAPQVERHDPTHALAGKGRIGGAGISLFRQHRPIGAGFARAFLSESHLAALGETREAVLADLDARCAAAPDVAGAMDWAVLHFRRGAQGFDVAQWKPGEPLEIGFP